MQKRPPKQGFTLIELLVVISIIAVLASLILPGIMSARKAARRAQCLNNMKNIGTALLQLVTKDGKFPASGYWDVDPAATAPNTVADDNDLASATAWNLYAPANTAVQSQPGFGMRYSWALEALPFLEGSNIYDQWDFTKTHPSDPNLHGSGGSYLDNIIRNNFPGGNAALANTSIKVFACPEDITTQQNQGNQSYAVNGGVTFHWLIAIPGSAGVFTSGNATQSMAMRENLRRMGLMFLDMTTPTSSANRRHTLESVKDGNTTTVMLSENVNTGIGSVRNYPSNWACPHPFNTSIFLNSEAVCARLITGNGCTGTGGTYDYARANTPGSSAPPVTDGVEGGINGDLTGVNEGQFPYPSSFHTGGVHVTFCDGNTRFISQTISAEVWARLITPDGGRLIDPRSASATFGQKVYETQANGWKAFTQIPLSEDSF